MVCYWQWIKWWLFAPGSTECLNKINRIKSLWLFWYIYFSYRKNYCYKNYCCAGDNPPRRKQSLAAATQVAFTNCAIFKDHITEIGCTFVDYADFINIAMPMYNLIEYSNNCSYSSGSLWGFKRDDVTNNADIANDHYAPSFKYKAIRFTDVEANERKNGVKMAVPPKYLSNFWRSLEMLLINCRLVC